MSTVQEICAAIGRDALATALGVSRQSISNAIANSAFPANWYLIIKSECDVRSIPCGTLLFKFKQHDKRDAA